MVGNDPLQLGERKFKVKKERNRCCCIVRMGRGVDMIWKRGFGLSDEGRLLLDWF